MGFTVILRSSILYRRMSQMGHEQTNRPRQCRVCLCSLNRLQSAAKLLPRKGSWTLSHYGTMCLIPMRSNCYGPMSSGVIPRTDSGSSCFQVTTHLLAVRGDVEYTFLRELSTHARRTSILTIRFHTCLTRQYGS